MRDLEKKKAAQKKYDLKRTSKIVSLSFRVPDQDEAELKEILKRFRVALGAMRKARSSSLNDELQRLVEWMEGAQMKTNASPEPEPAETFADGGLRFVLICIENCTFNLH